MTCRISFLPIFLVVLFGFCLSGVQSVSFDDIFDLDSKKDKYCKIPGLDFLCKEDDDEVSVSVSQDEEDSKKKKGIFLRA